MKAFPSSWANANTSIEPVTKDLREATSAIGQQIEVVPVSTNRDIERAFTSFETWVDALLVSPSPLLDNRRAQVVTLATYHRLPTMLDVPGEYQYRRSDELRIERFRTRPPCWHLCGSYPQRRKNDRVAGHTSVQVRVGHQPTDHETAWHRGPTHTPRARRRGPRIGAPGKAGAIQPVQVRPPAGPSLGVQKKNCTRRRNELIAKGAMNTGEYGLEYPKLAEVRPLIVGWSSVHRCPIGCVMLQSLPTHAGWLHAVSPDEPALAPGSIQPLFACQNCTLCRSVHRASV
jgi:hypothetical protein